MAAAFTLLLLAILDVTKENVTILGIYKNAEELLEVMDSGKAPGSFFKKIQL